MVAETLLTRCRDLGLTLALGPDGKLRISPRGVLPAELRENLKQYKAEVLALLVQQSSRPRPFINDRGELIIPFESDPRYHWWKLGGQSLAATLAELNASPESRDSKPSPGTL